MAGGVPYRASGRVPRGVVPEDPGPGRACGLAGAPARPGGYGGGGLADLGVAWMVELFGDAVS